ncbi:hypothetical protein EGR_01404 [Echinococcus granulosus]|uniref:Uncharacterized protein n=1 Tax=Echinococcus granulosus TaxID=6210 RepID=W6USX2_ECHGR|nr:hypothetical protein EGR_01404 [Echinococcus granulosus]EUB63781.1 hypothetical protein EGR_01404 [Echinococcus granulosus]
MGGLRRHRKSLPPPSNQVNLCKGVVTLIHFQKLPSIILLIVIIFHIKTRVISMLKVTSTLTLGQILGTKQKSQCSSVKNVIDFLTTYATLTANFLLQTLQKLIRIKLLQVIRRKISEMGAANYCSVSEHYYNTVFGSDSLEKAL